MKFTTLLCWILSLRFVLPLQTQDVSQLTVRLLDEREQPVAGVIVELILIVYDTQASGQDFGGQTFGLQEIPAGKCTTRSDGHCTLQVVDPPRLSDGYIQAWLIPGEYGRQLVGWYGEAAEITLRLADFYLAATLAAEGFPPQDGPYETPPDTPQAVLNTTPSTTLRASPAEAASDLTSATATPAASQEDQKSGQGQANFIQPWMLVLLLALVVALMLVSRKKKDTL
jgi:hypothetical protein